MTKRLKHVAVCGNIGSGKTRLTEKLAKHYGWHPLFESVDKNPYLEDFYEDMRWAFTPPGLFPQQPLQADPGHSGE